MKPEDSLVFARIKFENKFNTSWVQANKNKMLVNASDAAAQMGLTDLEMATVWEEAKRSDMIADCRGTCEVLLPPSLPLSRARSPK